MLDNIQDSLREYIGLQTNDNKNLIQQILNKRKKVMQVEEILCAYCHQGVDQHQFEEHQAKCRNLNKKDRGKQKQLEQGSSKELIPCSECGNMIPFNMYVFHLEDCTANQLVFCKDCGLMLANFVFDEHRRICPARQNSNQANHHDFQVEEKPKPKGLTKVQIRKLRPVLLAIKQECSICQSKMARYHQVIQLRCGHNFHKKCLVPWLEKNAKCPMCRTEVKGQQVKKKKK